MSYKYSLNHRYSIFFLYNDPGIFTNEAIQAEYVMLLKEGKQNLTSAFDVGVKNELMDIDDIKRLMERTEKADIERILYQSSQWFV